jgi:hypothetical protein
MTVASGEWGGFNDRDGGGFLIRPPATDKSRDGKDSDDEQRRQAVSHVLLLRLLTVMSGRPPAPGPRRALIVYISQKRDNFKFDGV